MQRCTPRRNIVCAPAQVCSFACVHRCVFVYTCARVCQCVHICITLARVTWGRIVHILWLRFPPAQMGATPGRHPRPTSGRCGSCGRRALGQGDRARDPVLGPPVEGCPSPGHFTSYPDATPGPLQLCELSLRAVLRWKSHEIRRQQCRKKIKYFFVFLIYEVRMCNQNVPFG